MDNQVVTPPENSRINILGLLAVIISLSVLAVGLFLSYTELGIFSDYVVTSGAETAGITKVNTRAIRSLLALVPSKTKNPLQLPQKLYRLNKCESF